MRRRRSLRLWVVTGALLSACGGASDFTIPDEEPGPDAGGVEAGADGAALDGSGSESDGASGVDTGAGDGGTEVDAADATVSDGGLDASGDGATEDGAANDASDDVTGDATGDAAEDAAGDAGMDADLDGGSDAPADGAVDGGGPDDAAVDGPFDAGFDGGGDASVDAGLDAGGCGVPDLTSAAQHVYVDKTAPAGGNGSLACPFRSIAPAAAFGSPAVGSTRTIHVRGAAATTYVEGVPVVVGPRVTLTSDYPGGGGADPGKVTVTAQGDCGGVPCAVHAIGGTVEGLTITVPSSGPVTHGIRGVLAPVIVNVSVTATGSGIVLPNGGGVVGPGVFSNGNGISGLVVSGAATKGAAPTLVLTAGGRGNRFDNNGQYGVQVTDAYALVVIEQAQASGNVHSGLLISANAAGTHELSNVTASGNGVVGARVSRGPVKVNGGSYDKNGIHGLFVGNGSDLNASTTLASVNAGGNGGDGVRVDTAHTLQVSGLVARGNGKNPGNLGGGAGLYVASGTSAIVRNAVLLENTVGLVFNQVRSNGGVAQTTLDLGASTLDPGGTTFGATPTTSNNKHGGLCISGAGANGSQLAVGDKWTSCAPTQLAITGNGATCYDGNGYADVLFIAATGSPTAPVTTLAATAPSCLVGTP